MTSATESIIEVAGRRLNPAVSPEWQHLLTHFELSEGFSFIVLLVPDSDWAQACRIALSRYFEVEGKGLLMVDYEDAEDFKVNLASRLLELHISYRTGAVWIEATVSEASSKYHEWVDAWRGMSARLNQFRNPLRSKIDIPLLFVGAHWIQPAIRDIAPDLWSVRTMVTRLDPPAEGGSASATWVDVASEKQLEGQAIDPDFALKTMILVLIGVTVPARLEHRQMGIEAGQKAQAYRIDRAFDEYREKFGGLPDNLSDLTRSLPDEDGSLAAALKSIDATGYRPGAELAAVPKQKPQTLRGAAIRNASIGGADDSITERLSFTNYELALPGPDKQMGTDDDQVLRDGVIYKASEMPRHAGAAAPLGKTARR